MSAPLTARRFVSEIRTRINDPNSEWATDADLLTLCDENLQTIWTKLRTASQQGWERDFYRVPMSSFTLVEQGLREYSIPEFVGDIAQVDAYYGPGRPNMTIPPAQSSNSILRGFRWYRRSDRMGKLLLLGEPGSAQSIDVWFTRRFPPMHYGSATVSSTTTITFPQPATAGRVVERNDVYNDFDVELDTDEVGRITDYDGATRTATVEVPWAGTGTFDYSMVVPIQQEHTKFLIELSVQEMYQRRGNAEFIRAHLLLLTRVEREFEAALALRDQGVPISVYNSRSS